MDAAGDGQRLDAWLAGKLTGQSRARLKAWIEDGRVLLEGRRPRPAAKVRPGQAVAVSVPQALPARPEPEPIPLAIVYQDAQLLVVDKPAGLVVHPGAGRASGTLVNALLHQVKDLSGVGGELRPGIVHRLDRGTSGLLVVAKDDLTHRALARQFAERRVEKEYVALVLGVPRPSQSTLQAPIGRDPRERKRMSVRPRRGRAASTTYRVVEVLDGASLLRIRIHTGRTHQIRVHLAAVGHPVAGDATYGGTRTPPSKTSAARAALAALTRPALHAALLAFEHPASRERVAFESPLPADLTRTLDALREASRPARTGVSSGRT